MSKWTGLKNIGWAMGIAVCLLALFVGLVIASVNRYSGNSFDSSTTISADTVDGSDSVVELVPGSSGNLSGLNTLSETPDAGQEYIDKLTFLCDSSFIGVRDYGLLSGGTGTYQVWGTSSGSMRIADINDSDIVFPSDGSSISIADAAMVTKPEILVICVGQDGLNNVDELGFKTAYTTLLTNILASSPNTKIICCSISSVTTGYNGADGLTTIMISDANDWIREVCASMDVYFTDSGKAVGDGTGSVEIGYLSSNGKTLNSSGINAILSYLRTHALN